MKRRVKMFKSILMELLFYLMKCSMCGRIRISVIMLRFLKDWLDRWMANVGLIH